MRRELAARLAALSAVTRRSATARAAARLAALPEFASARRIFTCLSFGDELDTWPLVDVWLAHGRKLYVPRADARDHQIHLHRYPCELVTLGFGLRQPRRTEPELAPEAIDATLEVAVVLGLGFDRRGYRLGYGGGYFDRLLAGRELFTIGLAFDEQLVESMPDEPHDVPMRCVVTDTETVRAAVKTPNA